jgi:hypothetical protein
VISPLRARFKFAESLPAWQLWVISTAAHAGFTKQIMVVIAMNAALSLSPTKHRRENSGADSFDRSAKEANLKFFSISSWLLLAIGNCPD